MSVRLNCQIYKLQQVVALAREDEAFRVVARHCARQAVAAIGLLGHPGPPPTCITTSCEYAAKYVNGLSMSAKSFRLTVTERIPKPARRAISYSEQSSRVRYRSATIILITAGLEEVKVSVTGIEIFRAVLQTATTGQEAAIPHQRR